MSGPRTRPNPPDIAPELSPGDYARFADRPDTRREVLARRVERQKGNAHPAGWSFGWPGALVQFILGSRD